MSFDKGFFDYWASKIIPLLEQRGLVQTLDYVYISGKESSFEVKRFLELLRASFTEEGIIELLFCVSCQYPPEKLDSIRDVYLKHKSLEEAHSMLQQQFIALLDKLQISDNIKHTIIEQKWGSAGNLIGRTVIATKIPKSGHIQEYFHETDPKKRASIYCHCPLYRETLLTDESKDTVYCYCGAGFYKAIWEYITGKDVHISILKSVAKGDDCCSFKIVVP